MNVLYVNHTVQRSGAGISLYTLVKSLPDDISPYFILNHKAERSVDAWFRVLGKNVKRDRFMPHFATTMYGDRLPFHLFVWQLIKTPFVLFSLLLFVRRWKIDLIHLNETTMLAYLYAAQILRVPAVVHARTALNSAHGLEMFLLRLACLRKTWSVICIDEEVKNTLPECCRNRAVIIYNPIDLGDKPAEKHVQGIRDSWGVAPDDVVIGQVSSLHKEKGVWEILDLAENLCSGYPQIRFVLVGDDSPGKGEGPQLRQAITDRGLEGCVIMPGYRTDLAGVYAAMDICLCLFGKSLGGVGRGVYEAGMASKPVIATLPNPATSKTLKNNVAAILHEPDDMQGVLFSLKKMIDDPELRRTLGKTANAYLSARHEPKRIGMEVMMLYNKMVNS